LKLVPSMKAALQNVHHDTVIIHSANRTTIQIEGHEFEIAQRKEDPEVRTVVRENTTFVIVDDEEVGFFNNSND